MKYNIITIEREYASGGREIGKWVAKRLGLPYYGKEILEMAAKRYSVSPEQLELLEERATNSFMYSLYMLSLEVAYTGAHISKEDALNLAEREIILEVASREPAVIIGRCASHILKDRNDVLNVFIHSSWEQRKQRAIDVYNTEPKKVEFILKQFDRRRSNYYKANTGKKWEDISNYHMVLDSGKLGIEACVNTLVAAM